MAGFTKLVPQIVQSSIWNETPETRCVWITILAVKDANGYVRGDAQIISRLSNIPIEAVEQALKKFQQPDLKSHTPDNDGRRIAPAPGGWMVLNHFLYRERDTKETRAEYMRKWRGENGVVNKPPESDPPPKKATGKFVKPTPEEVAEYASTIGFNLDGNLFCDHYISNGWKVGKTSMKSWKAAVRTWKINDNTNRSPHNRPPTRYELKSNTEHTNNEQWEKARNTALDKLNHADKENGDISRTLSVCRDEYRDMPKYKGEDVVDSAYEIFKFQRSRRLDK